MNKVALGLLSLSLAACSYGPFTGEKREDSAFILLALRTESNFAGGAMLLGKEEFCAAVHIEQNSWYGCVKSEKGS